MKINWWKSSLTTVFVLAVVVAGVYVFAYNPTPEKPVFRQSLSRFYEDLSGKVLGARCRTTGVIEYLYYKEPSEEEFRNNKFGLYIYAEERRFFDLAEELVNSNGGKWGYVLIPYNVKDRDLRKWERVFITLRSKKLIPIIQLYDVDVEHYEAQTTGAVGFLNRFVWPIKNRYISVYNEPNDARFWKGEVNPEKYAEVLDFTITAFRNENPNFFMINGAFNVSAPTSLPTYIDSFVYMRRMDEAVPGIFERLDGWASHSYPQPNFSGPPLATGRWSIRAYENELNYLKNELNVEKELPVFITETGWAHAEGERYNYSFLPASKVAEYTQTAYEEVWLKDNRVWAVTPFTIWYNPPFDHFSWINRDGEPYEHFEAVKSMEKVEGNPAKLEVGRVTSFGCN